jgi:hypothetical protein
MRAFSLQFARFAKKPKVGVPFHDLRHGFATQALGGGVDLQNGVDDTRTQYDFDHCEHLSAPFSSPTDFKRPWSDAADAFPQNGNELRLAK